MKYLSIDYGAKRVGLAVSDPLGAMAFPLGTIHRTTRDALFAELLRIITKENIEAVVVGLPLSHDTGPNQVQGEQEQLIVRQVKNFAASLGRRIDLPILLVDEYLTTQEAVARLRESGVSGKRISQVKDAHAAVCILESFLASQKP